MMNERTTKERTKH